MRTFGNDPFCHISFTYLEMHASKILFYQIAFLAYFDSIFISIFKCTLKWLFGLSISKLKHLFQFQMRASSFCSKMRVSSFYSKMCFKIEMSQKHFGPSQNRNEDENSQSKQTQNGHFDMTILEIVMWHFLRWLFWNGSVLNVEI